MSKGDGGSQITSGRLRCAGAVAIAMLCLAAAIAGPVAAAGTTQDTTDEASETVITLQQDGDAEVALTIEFDLTSDAEREAFEALRQNETERDALRTTYRDRMTTVAAAASNATGREMAVSDPSISFETVDNRGMISLTVSWASLAAVEGDALRVDEPFASGFAPTGEFTVVAPEEHEITSASPAPDDSADGRATWEAGSSLDGFDLVAAGGRTNSASADEVPGFGVSTAGIALIGTLGAVGYRRYAA